MGVAPLDRVAIGRRIWRRATFAGIGGNGIAAMVVFSFLVLLSPIGSSVSNRKGEFVVAFVAYMLAVMPVANRVFYKFNQPLRDALANGEPIVGDARRALFANPWRSALASYYGWSGAAILFAVLDRARLHDSTTGVVRLALTVELGGLTTLAVCFLLTERAIQPGVELALIDEPLDRSHGLDVWPRLVLSWLLGSAMPLLGTALAFLGRRATDFDAIRSLVLALVVVGLWAGGAITRRTARSVARPLGRLRSAMARVQEGQLDAHVTVDDASEVGLLQAGFNDMVHGLRERAELEDLFGRHVGVEVARQAMDRGVQFRGEVRNVSALFVDLIGSTTLASTRPAGEVVDILNGFFTAVVRVTGEQGGWVNKFEGDGALCVFGAPMDDADHASKALRSARALRAELAWLGQRYGVDAGIGVASGDAVAGNVGAQDRYEYTIIGDPVNEAARLTEEAKQHASRVLANGTAYDQAADDERQFWRACGTLYLRGRTAPTTAYEPVPG